MHEGKKWTCRECDYQTTTNDSIARHQRAIKEGTRDLINFLAISGDSKHFSFFSGKNPKKMTHLGAGGGVPQICVHPISYFLCDLKPHKKFQYPTITPSGRKVTWQKREKRKNAVNSGHLVP
jgi:hypothetical protein